MVGALISSSMISDWTVMVFLKLYYNPKLKVVTCPIVGSGTDSIFK